MRRGGLGLGVGTFPVVHRLYREDEIPVGVKKGDVIVSIDGRATGSFQTLMEIMSDKEVGQTITIEVDRAVFVDTVLVTKRLSLPVTLGARNQ